MKKFLILIILVSFSSCKNKIDNVERAFYFWRSKDWNLSDKEMQVCDSLKIQKLYVKFFEVDYNDEIGSFPISKTRLSSWRLDDLKITSIIPTV
ncbi:MAG: hypothetical protein IPP01_11485 [Saprospiraceae bacterium]|nr:hypothetical protein [Saprospiraceae bacterium]